MSLVRFRSAGQCVRYWHSLTRRHSFSHRHLSTSTSDPHLLFSAYKIDSGEQHFFSVPVLPELSLGPATPLLTLQTDPLGLTSSQCLNGLFCFYHAEYPSYFGAPILVYNPATQETINIPLDRPINAGADTTWNIKTHFGFDPSTNVHKVLRIRLTEAVPESAPRVFKMEFNVFTLGKETDSWREIDPKLPFDSAKFGSGERSVCLNGAMHWMHRYGDSIVAFDVRDERFTLIPLPDEYTEGENASELVRPERLVEVGGCLAVIISEGKNGLETKHLAEVQMLELWVLKDYDNHVWVKESIRLPFRWDESGRPVPFGSLPTGELLMKPLSLYKSPAWVLFYNREEKYFKKVDIPGLPEWVISGCRCLSFVHCSVGREGLPNGVIDEPRHGDSNGSSKD
jgi:F-box interacting protein